MYEPLWKRPRSRAEAIAVLADLGPDAAVIAGGTDLAPLLTSRSVRPGTLVDLGYADDLRFIRESAANGSRVVEIGATTTHAGLVRDPRVAEFAQVLRHACATVGGPQIRTRGTIGGNVVNASPAADGAVGLVALGARAVLESASGRRELPLTDLLLGPGEAAMAQGELLTALMFERPSEEARGVYLKEGQRNALAIAIASVAVVHEPRSGTASIALGSVAPTPVRAVEAEALFADRVASGTAAGDPELLREVAETAKRAASPIDDVRATAAYRNTLVGILTRRALERAVA